MTALFYVQVSPYYWGSRGCWREHWFHAAHVEKVPILEITAVYTAVISNQCTCLRGTSVACVWWPMCTHFFMRKCACIYIYSTLVANWGYLSSRYVEYDIHCCTHCETLVLYGVTIRDLGFDHTLSFGGARHTLVVVDAVGMTPFPERL